MATNQIDASALNGLEMPKGSGGGVVVTMDGPRKILLKEIETDDSGDEIQWKVSGEIQDDDNPSEKGAVVTNYITLTGERPGYNGAPATPNVKNLGYFLLSAGKGASDLAPLAKKYTRAEFAKMLEVQRKSLLESGKTVVFGHLRQNFKSDGVSVFTQTQYYILPEKYLELKEKGGSQWRKASAPRPRAAKGRTAGAAGGAASGASTEAPIQELEF